MAEVFEVAWAGFFERIMKVHLPELVPSVQEMYDAHHIEYPAPVSFEVVGVTRNGALIPTPPQGGDGYVPWDGPAANAPLADVVASAPTGDGSRPAEASVG